MVKHFALIFFLFIPQSLYSQASNIGADGKTFAQRRSDWLGNLPACSKTTMTEGNRRKWIWGWLIEGTEDFSRGSCTDDALEELLAWGAGTHAQRGILAYIAWEYSSLIASQTQTNIKNWYKNNQIGASAVFRSTNDQKRLAAMVGVYLYLIRWDTGLSFPEYGCPTSYSQAKCDDLANNWPSFSQNGNSYTNQGGPYNAQTLTRDWIENQIADLPTSYLIAGQREFHSTNYSRQFMTMLMLLWAGTPSSNPLHTKARMVADLLILDLIADTGNQLSQVGVRGRSQVRWLMNASVTLSPQFTLFGFSTQQYRVDIQGMWDYQYPVPNVIIDLGVWTDHNDSYWRYSETYNENAIIHNDDQGKWTFQKKDWGLGSRDDPRGGWSLVAREDGTHNSNQMIFFINDETQASLEDGYPEQPQSNYLGDYGRQFRGSMLADISKTNYLHLYKKAGFDWDDGPTVESGWTFYNSGNFAFAYKKLSGTDACLEAVTIGDEYSTYANFKTAMAGASCINNRYTDSHGNQIDSDDEIGLTVPGDRPFPFDRLYIKDSNGDEIVTWDYSGGTFGEMTVNYKGETLTYDYDEWFTTETEPPPEPFAGSYFISNTGDDGLAGTSPATAWETISKHNSETFASGDSILFNRDDEWREMMTIPSSGGGSASIVYGAYGSGADPIINGANLVTGWVVHSGNVWKATYTTNPNVVIDADSLGIEETVLGNVNAVYEWYYSSNTLYLYSTTDPDLRTIEAGKRLNCVDSNDKNYLLFRDIEFRGANDDDANASGGLLFTGTENSIVNCTVQLNYLGIRYREGGGGTVDSSVVKLNARSGVGISSSGGAVEIFNTTVAYNGNIDGESRNGIGATSSGGLIVRNCNIYGNGYGKADAGFSHGIYLDSYLSNGANTTIEYNRIFNNRSGHGLSINHRNTVARYNYVYNNFGGGIHMSDISTGGTNYIRIHGNIIWNNHFGIRMLDYNWNNSTQVFIFQNAFIDNNNDNGDYSVNPLGLEVLVDTNTLQVRNNVFTDNRGADYWLIRFNGPGKTQGNLTMDYNGFYKASADQDSLVRYDLISYDFAGWQGQGYDGNSFNENPDFVDGTFDDWPDVRLQAGAPGINSGYDGGAGAFYKFILDPDDTTWPPSLESQDDFGAWEIGPFVYEGGAPPPTPVIPAERRRHRSY